MNDSTKEKWILALLQNNEFERFIIKYEEEPTLIRNKGDLANRILIKTIENFEVQTKDKLFILIDKLTLNKSEFDFNSFYDQISIFLKQTENEILQKMAFEILSSSIYFEIKERKQISIDCLTWVLSSPI